MPTTRADFWSAKIQRNQLRDKNIARLLRDSGWKVIRVWEHELARKNESSLLKKISRHLLAGSYVVPPTKP